MAYLMAAGLDFGRYAVVTAVIWVWPALNNSNNGRYNGVTAEI